MQYPRQLVPQQEEAITLSSGSVVCIPKATPIFEEWDGQPLNDTYGNKPVLKVNDKPAFAELVILRLFQEEGWRGVWVDTYRQKYRIDYWRSDSVVALPPEQARVFDGIYARAGKKRGCFDVFCWKGGNVLFAEAKRQGRDAIRETQLRWIEAALAEGLPLEAFLIVEWKTKQKGI